MPFDMVHFKHFGFMHWQFSVTLLHFTSRQNARRALMISTAANQKLVFVKVVGDNIRCGRRPLT